ncbi:MAG TPA: LPS-assembly protein LptD, partial [Zeimonas sp.]|nr:LPS-assembly protein LptD [Zeimonas sp.]
MRRPRIRTILAHLARLLAALSIASAAAAQSTGGFGLKLDPRLDEERAGVVEGRPVFGRGERLYGRTGRETTLEGDAELRKAGTTVRADRMTYY